MPRRRLSASSTAVETGEPSISVNVKSGSDIVYGGVLVLTSPLWLPPLVAIQIKYKYDYWRHRKLRRNYLATRDLPDTTRPHPYPLSIATEDKTGRAITLETATSSRNLDRCHAQEQSPLFALPAEIRTLIYEFALSSKKNEDERDLPFPVRKPVCGVNLLLTCRRVWLEANGNTARCPDPVIWAVDPFTGVRGSLREGKELVQRYFQHLSATNTIGMKSIRIVGSYAWLPRWSTWNLIPGSLFQWPEQLTLTFWHTGKPILAVLFIGITDVIILKILRQAQMAGVAVVRLEFVAQDRAESHLLDTFLLLLTSRQRQMEWPCFRQEDWAALSNATEGPLSGLLIKSLQWERDVRRDSPEDQLSRSPMPSLQGCYHTRQYETRKTHIDEEQVAQYTQRWEAEGSLMRFL